MVTGLEEFGIVDDSDERAVEPNDPDGPHTKVALPAEDVEDAHTGDEIVEILGGMTLFDGLLPVHLSRMAKLVVELEIKKNDFVFRHGDTGDGLYLVLDGAVRISRSVAGMGEEALAILRPGQYFGEMCIVDDDAPRSADAISHETCKVLKLSKDDLRDLMFVDRELAYELLWRFVRTLSGRLRESNDRLLMLTVSSKF
jgi:CRP/FNR family cyclic AMP-dependent transcriptional regulator